MNIKSSINSVIRDSKLEIDSIISDCSQDIMDYLQSDVPLECYYVDIDLKLSAMKQEILSLFE